LNENTAPGASTRPSIFEAAFAMFTALPAPLPHVVNVVSNAESTFWISTATRSAYVVFAVIASLGVVAPVVIFFTMGDRAGPILDDVKAWLAHNNAAIMAVLFLVIGAKILGQGIAG
jgi:hypothetical protein